MRGQEVDYVGFYKQGRQGGQGIRRSGQIAKLAQYRHGRLGWPPIQGCKVSKLVMCKQRSCKVALVDDITRGQARVKP